MSQTGAFALPRGLSRGNHRRRMVREGEGRGPWPKERETRSLTLTGTIEGVGWCAMGAGEGPPPNPPSASSLHRTPPPITLDPPVPPQRHQSQRQNPKQSRVEDTSVHDS